MVASLRLLVVTTGLLLATLAQLQVLTGVALRNPWLVENITLGLLDYSTAAILHSKILPLVLTPLAATHIVVAVELAARVVERLGRGAKLLALVYRVVVWVLTGIVSVTTLVSLAV